MTQIIFIGKYHDESLNATQIFLILKEILKMILCHIHQLSIPHKKEELELNS